jgi:hypothetical protein
MIVYGDRKLAFCRFGSNFVSSLYFLTPDITQAFTAVILQRHRDVGTALYSIGTGWDFEGGREYTGST